MRKTLLISGHKKQWNHFHDVNVRTSPTALCSTHLSVLTDGYRSDYWLPGSSFRCTVEPGAAGEVLLGIHIIMQPLMVTNSLLAMVMYV